MTVKVIQEHNIKCPNCGENLFEVQEEVSPGVYKIYGACKKCKIAIDGDNNKISELKSKKAVIESIDFEG